MLIHTLSTNASALLAVTEAACAAGSNPLTIGMTLVLTKVAVERATLINLRCNFFCDFILNLKWCSKFQLKSDRETIAALHAKAMR